MYNTYYSVGSSFQDHQVGELSGDREGDATVRGWSVAAENQIVVVSP